MCSSSEGAPYIGGGGVVSHNNIGKEGGHRINVMVSLPVNSQSIIQRHNFYATIDTLQLLNQLKSCSATMSLYTTRN